MITLLAKHFLLLDVLDWTLKQQRISIAPKKNRNLLRTGYVGLTNLIRRSKFLRTDALLLLNIEYIHSMRGQIPSGWSGHLLVAVVPLQDPGNTNDQCTALATRCCSWHAYKLHASCNNLAGQDCLPMSSMRHDCCKQKFNASNSIYNIQNVLMSQ